MKIALLDKLFKGVVEAVKFVTTDGTSSDFVKGDGSLDNTVYSTQADIDNSINDIEIGGRNLLLKSNKLDEIIIPHTTTQLTVIPIGNDFKVESTGGSSTIKARIDQVLPEPFAGEYTCSFYIKNKSTKEIIVILRAINTTSVVIPALYEGFISFTRVKNTTAQSLLYFTTDDVANNLDFEISPIKLEKGNKPTDWTPAPEDQVTDWDETNPDSFSFLKNKPLDDIVKGVTAHSLLIDGGISRTSQLLDNTNDLDLVVTPGYYHHSGGSSPLNKPVSASVAGYVEVINNGTDRYIRQIWRGRDLRLEYQRTKHSSGAWSDWVVYYNSDNFNPSDYALASHNHNGIYEPVFSKNTAFNKNFGTSAGTVTEGNDSRLSNSREWTASTVTKAEAEAGTATTRRAWTAQRVRQAIEGWWNNLGTAFGRGFITLNNASSARNKLELGNSATRDVGQDAGTVMEGNDERIVDGGVPRTAILLKPGHNLNVSHNLNDYNSIEDVGFYYTEYSINQPIGGKGTLEVLYLEDIGVTQRYTTPTAHIAKLNEVSTGMYLRHYSEGTWTKWTKIASEMWVTNNFPTFADLYGVNTVIEGGYYLVPGEAYKYFVWASKYVIDGVLYNEYIEGEVILNPAHPTLNRFDLIVVTTDEQEPFKVIEGVPAENPVRPNFDRETEVDLTFIYVNSVASGGGQVGNYLLVYDENEGWPNEANASITSPGGMPTADLEFTTYTYRGDKSIKFLNTHPHYEDRKIIFTFNSLKELSDYDKIVIHTMNIPPYGGIKYGGVLLFKNSQTNSIVREVIMAIGGHHSFFLWQQHVVSLEGGSGEFDIIELIPVGSSDFVEGTVIDYIFLSSDTGTGTGTSGGQNLIERTSQIPINDGEDGSSPYATQKWVEEYSGGMVLLVGDVILNNWRANINNRVFIHNGDGGTGIGIWLTGNEGAEFTILNNSNQELTVMSGSNLFVKLMGMGIGSTSPGGFKIIDTFPKEYKGRFKVVNGEFLEIG